MTLAMRYSSEILKVLKVRVWMAPRRVQGVASVLSWILRCTQYNFRFRSTRVLVATRPQIRARLVCLLSKLGYVR